MLALIVRRNKLTMKGIIKIETRLPYKIIQVVDFLDFLEKTVCTASLAGF